ncbi:MAG: hypothetical protein RR975_01760 [Clostridia bacterium]
MKKGSICLQISVHHLHLQWLTAVIIMGLFLMAASCSFAEESTFPIAPTAPADAELSTPNAIQIAGNALIALSVAVPTPEDISSDEAIDIAKGVLCETESINRSDVADYIIKPTFVLLSNEKAAWVITFFDRKFNDPTDVSIMIASPDATVLSVQKTNIGYFKEIRNIWQEKMGNYAKWSLAEQALFDRLYTVQDDLAVPNEEMLSQEAALSIALAALPVAIEDPEINYSLVKNSSLSGINTEYIWRIVFLCNGKKLYQVNLSALDGTVYDVFDLSNGKG